MDERVRMMIVGLGIAVGERNTLYWRSGLARACGQNILVEVAAPEMSEDAELITVRPTEIGYSITPYDRHNMVLENCAHKYLALMIYGLFCRIRSEFDHEIKLAWAARDQQHICILGCEPTKAFDELVEGALWSI